MAKKTFGRGSIHDLVLASEKEKKEKENSALNAVTADSSASDVPEVLSPLASETPEAPEAFSTPEVPNNANNVTIAPAIPPEGSTAQAPQINTAEKAAEATKIGLSASANEVLNVDNIYQNSKRQINIAENYYTFLKAVSNVCGVNISQMVNNMLHPYFEDKALMKEIKRLADKMYKTHMNVINSNIEL
jgi:hypothetical protein